MSPPDSPHANLQRMRFVPWPRLERRAEPSLALQVSTPIFAVAASMVAGAGIFALMGYHGPGAVWEIFVTPLIEPRRWQDLALKASPLVLIATGLAVGFRAGVWNIGAEGQYVVGALAGTGVALATWHLRGPWILPLMVLAGAAGGALYAAIPAWLKVRRNVNEILSSLMLNYVAIQLLYYLTRGPWKDPDGFNFPQTRLFNESQQMPLVWEGSLLHVGVLVSIAVALVVWGALTHTVFGYRCRVSGEAPIAARLGGFGATSTTWLALTGSGALAGLAGIIEAAGPFGQLVPQFPLGYGFSAIIVAFVGRLHPIGILLAALILAATIVGGEGAQRTMGLPSAGSEIVQAMMLFFLLASNVMVTHRIRFAKPAGQRAELAG